MELNANKEDASLTRACLEGDELAFKELLDKYLKPIHSFLFYMVKDTSAAEDLTQETFIKVWKNLRKFDQEKSFKTWLFAIAKNTALDFLKKKKTTPFSFFEDEEGNNRLDDVSENLILPDEILERKDIVREMEDELAKIPEKYRVILTLHYKEDFTLSEIAEILGRPYNTIKAYHSRALLQLKKAFLDK
ncbi:MAG: RNA polymerase sigma factor [Parcubacteria group bacterium]